MVFVRLLDCTGLVVVSAVVIFLASLHSAPLEIIIYVAVTAVAQLFVIISKLTLVKIRIHCPWICCCCSFLLCMMNLLGHCLSKLLSMEPLMISCWVSWRTCHWNLLHLPEKYKIIRCLLGGKSKHT